MENENIEVEVIQTENEFSGDDVGIELISEYPSILDVEEFESVPEKIMLEEVETVPELVPDPVETDSDLEEILKEYFLKKESTEQSEIITEDSSNIEENENTSDIDYTLILEDILQTSNDSYDTVNEMYTVMNTREVNNVLSAAVDDISLTNTLLLCLLLVLMFNGVLDFARRII